MIIPTSAIPGKRARTELSSFYCSPEEGHVMNKLTKVLAIAGVLSASALTATSANAWWDMPFFGNGLGNGVGDGNFSFNMNARSNMNAYGNGYGNGYGYAPYGYGYAPYGY